MKQKNKNNPTLRTTEENPRPRFLFTWKPWMEMLLFALFAGWMLLGMNSDYLFTTQERSLFLSNSTFFHEMTATPHGLISWVGSYLTQFFYYPSLGASLLIFIWIGTYLATLKAFDLKKKWSFWALIPITAMLCSIIGLGYWVYRLKMPGYWFSESLSLCLVMLATWGARGIRGWGKYIYLVVWTTIGYPILGWYALFGTLLICLVSILPSQETNQSRSKMILCTIASIGIVPLLWYYHYDQLKLEDAWVYGFPRFEQEEYFSWIACAPFLIMTVTCILLAIGNWKWWKRDFTQKRMLPIVCRVSVLLGCAILVWVTNFDDYNYQAEMRMYRHAEENNWQEVLKEARQCPESPTRQMVLLKHIALMNIGDLGNQMFRYDNTSKLPHKRDKLEINLVYIAAPIIYYSHGKLNFATRWAIENGVEFGFKVSDLKTLIKCALVSGEFNAAKKYINLLSQTTFHKDEAKRLEEYCRDPQLIDKSPEFKVVKELYTHGTEDLDSDTGLCEMYLLHHFSNTMNIDSRILQEVTLNYALISKDIQLFWPRFFQYANLHEGEEMPIHYQEAAYLYGNLESTSFDISKMPFDKQKIKQRYTQFNSIAQYNIKKGMSEQQVAEILKPTFGDTFWWFYFFCNNISSY